MWFLIVLTPPIACDNNGNKTNGNTEINSRALPVTQYKLLKRVTNSIIYSNIINFGLCPT
jgi:hypothetical protein